MPAGFVTVPPGDVVLRRGRIPSALLDGAVPGPVDAEGLVGADIVIRGGRIAGVAPPATGPAMATVDLDDGQIWPCFVDLHTHLDKGHIWPRAANPDGTFQGAFSTTSADREANWNARDVRRRMEFGLRCAYAHGTAAVRTHLDSHGAQAPISWPVFRELREAWRGRIDLQATSLAPIDFFGTPAGERLADLVAESGGQLGAVTRLSGEGHGDIPPQFLALLDRVFELAEARRLDLDLHVDESGEQGAVALGYIARAALRRKFKGRILCGHCCSLAVQPEPLVKETLALCADAGLAVVSLPMCNLYLQDRVPGRTPRWRGVTLLHEMKAAGIPVSVASDNCRDPFYGFGDHDVVEVFTQAARIAHLDRPYADWPRAVTATPAAAMGLSARGMIRVGAVADLVLFRARTMSELLSRHQGDRVVLREGRAIDATLPDYRELDDLFARPKAAE
ncbi:MAG: cytosine deaminase [Alphaproteobacteria bacterium]|nr:cytosine deaminase [Alphaproteobacteria bacterium]